MIRATTCLCIWLVLICVYIQQNHAATKVLYEFHIREPPNEPRNERNETGVLRQNNDDESNGGNDSPELIVTGSRTSSFILPGQNPNTTNYVYRETATYFANNTGYHVKYNISIEPLELDTRLDGKTLKTLG